VLNENHSQTPVLAQCSIKASYKFSSGQGAVLVMERDTISTVDPPGSLRRLLEEPSLRDLVVVSEVHSSSSYARLLTTQTGATVTVGLCAKPPVDAASVSADASWVRSSNAGNFKSRVVKKGTREFYPLFRLVSLKEEAISTGLRDFDDRDPPLPDATPPWQAEDSVPAQDSEDAS